MDTNKTYRYVMPHGNFLIVNPQMKLKAHSGIVEYAGKTYHTIPRVIELLPKYIDEKYLFSPHIYRYVQQYDYPFTPMEIQKLTAEFLIANKAAYCLSTPRTGKTLAALLALDYVHKIRGDGISIIIAPLTPLVTAWVNSLTLFNLRVSCIQGSSTKRKELLKKDNQVILLNPEGVEIVLSELLDILDTKKLHCLIFDELTEYKNHQARKWKQPIPLRNKAEFVWGLTGTPGTASTVYGQIKMITPHNMQMSHYSWQQLTQIQTRIGSFKDKPGAGAIINERMQPAIYFNKDDHFDIPKINIETVHVPLSTEQEKIYDELINSGKAVVKGLQSFSNIKTRLGGELTKLLQVSAGVVIDIEGNGATIDCSARIDKVVELCKSTPNKTVIYSAYVGVIAMLIKELSARGLRPARVDGTIVGKERSGLINGFMDGEDHDVLICHPKTTSYGIELSAADKIIFYGPHMCGAFLHEQALHRIQSSKQTSKELFVYYLASSLIEKVMFKSIGKGLISNADVVKLFSTK